jgi:hypothetical protein
MSEFPPERLDPSRCPGCKTPVPEEEQFESQVTCSGCGQWELKMGLLVGPVAGPPGTPPEVVRQASPYWKRRQTAPRSSAPQPESFPVLEVMARASRLVLDGIAPHLAAVGDSPAALVALQLWQRACANDKAAVGRLLNPLLADPDPTFFHQVQGAMAQVVSRACRKATLASLPTNSTRTTPEDATIRPSQTRENLDDPAARNSGPAQPPAGPLPSSSTTAPRNPYRELLNLALRVHQEELNRATSFAGKRREAPHEWGPRFRATEAELQALFEAALLAADRTAFGVEEVERRVNALIGAVKAIALWQRDAPGLSREERENMEFSGVWHDPAVDYLSEHYRRMVDAMQAGQALAVRADGVELIPQKHQAAPNAISVTAAPSRASSPEEIIRVAGQLIEAARLVGAGPEVSEQQLPALATLAPCVYRLEQLLAGEFAAPPNVIWPASFRQALAGLAVALRELDSCLKTDGLTAGSLYLLPEKLPALEQALETFQAAVRAALPDPSLPEVEGKPAPTSPTATSAEALQAQHKTAREEPRYQFERVNTVWHLRFDSEAAQMADTLSGMKYIARLLQKKHVAVSALQLEGHEETAIPRVQTDAPVLDEKAKADYCQRLCDIDKAMKEVEEWEDRSEHDRLAQEKEDILAQLKAGVGWDGKDRLLAAGNEANKAAGRVRKAIAGVRDQLESQEVRMQGLARHLKQYIKKEGPSFAYRPPPPEPDWRVSF